MHEKFSFNQQLNEKCNDEKIKKKYESRVTEALSATWKKRWRVCLKCSDTWMDKCL